jgi:hypothetical protein
MDDEERKEERKEIVKTFMKENSLEAKEAELSDKMRTAGLSATDIQALYRLPVNRESLMAIVDNLIVEKVQSSRT